MNNNQFFHIICIVSGCIYFASSQMIPGFRIPRVTQVYRNWSVISTTPIGTVVTVVDQDKTDLTVTYSLETSGPPTPFQIDPKTGVVIVNDTLKDKEDQSYFIWVTASDEFLIPQRTEVFAKILPSTPRPPPLAISNSSNIPLEPRPTEKAIKALNSSETSDITKIIPTTTLASTSSKVEEPHENKMANQTESMRSLSKVSGQGPSNKVSVSVIPLAGISGLVAIVSVINILV